MPATAGRVRMPANNRVHSSAALQTHSIWQSAIGYDPYAPNKVNKPNKVTIPNKVNKEADNKGAQQADPSSDPEAENAYNSFQGLLALARVTNSNADEARGCCKKCGRVGHLNFQCRNFLSIKDDKDKDLEAIEAAVMAGLDKVKGNRGKGKGKGRDGVESSEESSEEESESSDSDYDSEIERAIAKNKKYGKKVSSLLKSSSRKKKDGSDDDVSDREGRKKRGRSRKRRSGKKADSESDIEDERRHGRRGSRREKRRRRSHREAEGSGSPEGSDRRRKRSSRRAAEDYNVSSLEDSRVGRDGKKRSEKESRKQLYEREI